MRPPARTALTALGAVGAVGLGAAVWGFGIERYLFTLRRHELAILPAGSPSLTVLHLSDAHMAPWQRRKQRWIADLADLTQPDLVVNTGDNLGHEDGLRGIRAAFTPLAGIPGVFVHGSNDVTAPSGRNPFMYFRGPSAYAKRSGTLDTAAMDDYFTAELGWTDLNNTATTLDVGGLRVDAVGVDDAHRDWDDLDGALAALDGLATDGAFRLGVTHAPYRRVLDRFTDAGVAAILAGHTHGGQVRIPFSSKALVANCDIPLDQARGLSTWRHDHRAVPLNVSAGLGHSIYAPVRFACLPEASVLTLRAGSSHDSSDGHPRG
ncbi:metallophosphoesterase [Microbacterium dauci]|uniref:Metallophosphoesterase n=1 Tax=Microbacterium dauci TaxID=3048008 RepID=A0ABT6ZFE0_9MICO|nr:metallophosphoesterase [Microbacterium sp. LX3-4]MDJ1114869.1 metallophosphoesterase [Microbacterium sp. LX3-4]